MERSHLTTSSMIPQTGVHELVTNYEKLKLSVLRFYPFSSLGEMNIATDREVEDENFNSTQDDHEIFWFSSF